MGTASPRITRMLAVESLVPTRHTQSRVCVLILLPRSLVVVMIFVLFLANPCPFPKFDGENPRLWKDRCEMYFEVFGVSEHMKTRFAALNFEGPAASWLQTLELCVGVFSRGLLFAQPFVSVLIEISIRSICVNLMPCDKLAPWQITITVLSNCPIAAL